MAEPTASAHHPNAGAGPLRAAYWMAGWLLLMVLIAVAGREATRELSVFQVMALRSLFGIAMIWPLVHAAGGLKAMRSERKRVHLLRNGVHYAAQYGWFAALALIPLAEVVALEFTMPLWAALLAAWFLRERLTSAKLLAVALGLAGVALVMRPGAGVAGAGHAIALAAAFGFAVSVVLVKSLTATESAVRIIFWMLVMQGLMGALPAWATWQWPSPSAWAWVLLVAFCGTYSHYCFTRALQHAEATVVVPMDFLRVPLTALAGWALYNERVDLFTVAGVVLVLAGNLLNLRRTAPK